ncbi:MAG: type II secretion system F family protein [Chloroflexota bacterium]
MMTSANLAFAAIGSLGVWLLLSTLTTLFRGISFPLRRGVNLQASAHAIDTTDADQQLNLFRHQPFFHRMLAPILTDLSRTLMPLMCDATELQRLLVQAGRPEPYRTVADFMAWKMLMALAGFVFGLVSALVSGSFALLLPLVLGGTLIGFFLPNRQLQGLIRARSEELVHEMAFVLDRIAILLASGMTLPLALARVSRSEGGWFIAELKTVVAEYDLGVPIEQALVNMARRNPDIPELERLVGRIAMTAAGLGLIDSLVIMATLARERLEQVLLSRARENSIKMLLPVGLLMLPAMFIALLAPGIVNIMRALQ